MSHNLDTSKVENISALLCKRNFFCSLLFGFMATTFFLSMWISNVATTAMMLPTAEAVMRELLGGNVSDISTSEKTGDLESGESEVKGTSFSSNPTYEPFDDLDDISNMSQATDVNVSSQGFFHFLILISIW